MDVDRLTHLRGLIETRQWEKAWGEFQRLKDEGPPSAHLLLMGSHAAFGMRDLFRARHLADQSLAAWNSSDPVKLLGLIRFHLGMVTRELGDTHVAMEQFQQFLSELFVKYPELSMAEGKAHFYLGLTYRQRRDLDASVESYRSAIACFRRDGLPTLLCAALHNLAWLFCHMNQPAEACECLEESDGLVSTHELRVHQLLGEAFLAAIEGKLSLATELCGRIFRMAERGETVLPDEQSQAAWIAAKVAMEQGNLDSAAALADIALTYATDAKDSRLINDASTLRRGIHLQRQAGAS